MTTYITDTKKLDKAIASIGTAGAKLDTAIHTVAMSCLYHASVHGDVEKTVALVKAMPKSSRVKGLIAWIECFTPVRIKLGDNSVSGRLEKGWKAEDFELSNADAKPFWSWKAEPNVSTMDVKAMLAWLSKKATSTDDKRVSPEAKAMAARLIEAAKAMLPDEPTKTGVISA